MGQLLRQYSIYWALLCAPKHERIKKECDEEPNLVYIKQIVTETRYYAPSWKYLLSPPTPSSQWLVPLPGFSTFSLWVWIIRLSILSSPPNYDDLEGGDHVLSYLKSGLILVLKETALLLFVFFLFVAICNLIDRISFFKPSWGIFPFKA